jgi:hypothetical protein
VFDALTDLTRAGQRTDSFVFRASDAATGAVLGEVHPARDTTITLDQSAGTVITRSLSLQFDEATTAALNPLTTRIEPYMLVHGVEWPLGHYLFTDPIRQDYAPYEGAPGVVRSTLSSALGDRMTIVDTELEHAFTGAGAGADEVIRRLLAPLPFSADIDDSASPIVNAWAAGTSRVNVLGTTAELGDYLAPWFDHHGVAQARRRFEPGDALPDFDWDANPVALRDSITRADALAFTPNRIVVVGNGETAESAPVIAWCDVPSTAPHSALNIGFVRPHVVQAQVQSLAQAQALADNLCLRQSVSETMQVTTVLDPRHEAHQVIRFEGELWLEVAWSMELVAGGGMRHTLQRAYVPDPVIAAPTVFA